MFPRSNRPRLISQQTTSNEQPPQPPASPAREPEPVENQPVPSTPDPNRVRQYGYYEDTHWYCNCKPLTRAVFRHTKKAGRNQGRCFWGCRHIKNGCGFFLWLEDAEERQAAFVPNSEMSAKKRGQESLHKYFEIRPRDGESPQPPETPTRRPPSEGETGDSLASVDSLGEPEGDLEEVQLVERPSTPPPREPRPQPEMPMTPVTAPVPITPHSKRRRDEALEDEDYLSELSPEEEKELITLADSATRRSNMSPPRRPTTPTPVRTRPVANPPTPQTEHRHANPSASTAGSLAAKRQRVLGASSAAASSSRFQAPPRFNNPTTPARNTDDFLSANDATEIADLMALLEAHNSPPEVCQAVRTSLNRFAARTASANNSRDLLRAGMERSQERIAALQARVADLENTHATLRGLLAVVSDT